MMMTSEVSDVVGQKLFNLRKSISCPICLDIFLDPCTLACSHSFCKVCIGKHFAILHQCPLCKAAIAKTDVKKSDDYLRQLSKSALLLVDRCESKFYQPSLPNDGIVASTSTSMQQTSTKLAVGDLVTVAPRQWPGINKPGGVAWITDVHEDVGDGTLSLVSYNVKYVLEGTHDALVPSSFVSASDMDVHTESSASRRKRRSVPKNSSSLVQKSQLVDKAKKVKLSKEDSSGVHMSSNTKARAKKRKTAQTTVLTAGNGVDISTNHVFRLVGSMLTDEDAVNVDELIRKVKSVSASQQRRQPGITIEMQHRFDALSTTHLIVPAGKCSPSKEKGEYTPPKPKRTMKYMQSLMHGLFIISSDWVCDSVQAGHVVAEEKYEVNMHEKADLFDAPRRSRLDSSRLQDPLLRNRSNLFSTFTSILVYGSYPHPAPAKSNLEEFLECGRGNVASNISIFFKAVMNCQTQKDSETTVNADGYPCSIVICSDVATSLQFHSEWEELLSTTLQPPSIANSTSTSRSGSGINKCPIHIILPMWVLDSVSNYNVEDVTNVKYKPAS